MAATARVRRVGWTCVVVGAGALVVSGCGGRGIAVSAPTPTGSVAAACTTLIDGLPDDLAAGGSRTVTHPSSPYAAAFGSPPVVVRCGVVIPRYAPTADVLTVDGVEWLVVPDSTTSQRFVSFHSELPVEVTITLPQLPASVLPAVSALLSRPAAE